MKAEFKSIDGGNRSYRAGPAKVTYDLWINLKTRYMIQSNGRRANVSLDGGRTWSTQKPTSQQMRFIRRAIVNIVSSIWSAEGQHHVIAPAFLG